MRSRTLACFTGWFGFLVLFVVTPAGAQSNQTLYADSLQNGWINDSWATVNFSNPSPVHTGSDSISVTAGAWTAVYWHLNTPFNPATYTNLSFWINGGTAGGQLLQVQAVLSPSAVASGIALPALAVTNWQLINAPMSGLVPPGVTQIDGFWIQDRTGTAQPTFYVDDVVLQAGPAPGTEEVRRRLSKIPGSMTGDFIAEREDR